MSDGIVRPTAEIPPLSTGVLDVRGVRWVRLVHVVDWLADLEQHLRDLSPDDLPGELDLARAIRYQLEQAGEA